MVSIWLASRFATPEQACAVFALSGGNLEPLVRERQLGLVLSTPPPWMKFSPRKLTGRLREYLARERSGSMAAEQLRVYAYREQHDAAALTAVIQAHCIQTVHFHFLSTLALCKVAKRNGCRVVYTHHNTLTERHPPADIKFLKDALRDIDQVVCVSLASADDFAAATDIERTRVRVIMNPTIVQPTKRHTLSSGEMTQFGTASNLGGVKRVDVLLDAFAAFVQGRPALGPKVHLHVAGGPPPVVAKWRRYAETLGLSRHISFYGRLSTEQMVLFYEKLDCMVICSDSEASPLQAIEAMSCGLPIVASNITALTDTLQDAAMYFPSGDSNGLAAVMRTLASSPADAANLSIRGRRRWEQMYHPDLVEAQYREALALP